MKNERVPHEVHIQGGPIHVFIVDEVKEGERICSSVCEGKNCVEEDEECKFGRHNVPG